MLKSGVMERGIVYINRSSSQYIYQDLENIFAVSEHQIMDALNAMPNYNPDAKLEDQTGLKFHDLYAATIHIHSGSRTAMHHTVENLKENVRYYDDTDKKIKRLADHEQQSLKGQVLFIDEALFVLNQIGLIRLQFLRNLGGALGMRVILADTSVAKIVSLLEAPGFPISRSMFTFEEKAVIIFLRREHDGFKNDDHHSQLRPFPRKSRPWLVNESTEATIKSKEAMSEALKGNSGMQNDAPEPPARDIILRVAEEVLRVKQLK